MAPHHGRTVSPTPTPHSEIVYSPPRPTIDQDPQSWSEPKTDADKKRDEEHKQYISQIDKHGKKRVDPLLPLAVERQSARSTKGLEPSPPLLQTPPAPPVFNPNDPRIQSLVFDSNQSSVPTIAKSEEPVARNLAESLFSSDAELEGYGFI
ncbi:hypothetical protein BLNAU_2929 [Blattamonas nauphoetae]|uniref:Uncharacterized protein n=1 Tax=Blattamonas nauphoetae TaxID=2049346 RepID=A0ABQ9YFB2_9EUKA|nr:hypothetical protein BLNAU_2929 [Blattamonas nauphoetae]